MEYDSTENAYSCYGSGQYYCARLMPLLDSNKYVVLEMDVKTTLNNWLNNIGFVKYPQSSDAESKLNYSFRVRGSNTYDFRGFKPNSDNLYDSNSDANIPTRNNWVTLKVVFNHADMNAYYYDTNGNLLASLSKTGEDYDNPRYGIVLCSENGTRNSQVYIRNIKATVL